jgi:hypothetical protein
MGALLPPANVRMKRDGMPFRARQRLAKYDWQTTAGDACADWERSRDLSP